MTQEEHNGRIMQAKDWRQRLDIILQEMKAQQEREERGEHGRHLALSITHTEDAIMRQGMRLKALDVPTPYPSSYDKTSTVVHPTADGLKM